MTGRELIIYILQNHLEDEVFFEDDRIPGFMSTEEVALKIGVGTATVRSMYDIGMLRGIKIGDSLYFLNSGGEIVNE